MTRPTHIAVRTCSGERVSRIGRHFTGKPLIIAVADISELELAALRGEKGLLDVEPCQPPPAQPAELVDEIETAPPAPPAEEIETAAENPSTAEETPLPTPSGPPKGRRRG